MNYRLFQPDDFHDLYAIEEVLLQPPERFTRRYMRQLIASPDAATWIAEQVRTWLALPSLNGPSRSPASWRTSPPSKCCLNIADPASELNSCGASKDQANAERAVQIWLHVDAENTAAIQLYERSGYCNSGRADHFYARNRPRIHLCQKSSIDAMPPVTLAPPHRPHRFYPVSGRAS